MMTLVAAVTCAAESVVRIRVVSYARIHRAGPQLVFFAISFLSYPLDCCYLVRNGWRGDMSVKWKLEGKGHEEVQWWVVTASPGIQQGLRAVTMRTNTHNTQLFNYSGNINGDLSTVWA
jgi:hypothetical protein